MIGECLNMGSLNDYGFTDEEIVHIKLCATIFKAEWMRVK